MWLIFSGIVALLFGLLFVSDGLLGKIGAVGNQIIAPLDEILYKGRMFVGLILVAAGLWIAYVAANYTGLAWLNVVWIIAVFFGLLFLFLSPMADGFIKSFDSGAFTDELVLGSRKVVGIILVIVSLWIFYSAYLVR